jgi:hypothetical protein
MPHKPRRQDIAAWPRQHRGETSLIIGKQLLKVLGTDMIAGDKPSADSSIKAACVRAQLIEQIRQFSRLIQK